jgi:hypothetical protein
MAGSSFIHLLATLSFSLYNLFFKNVQDHTISLLDLSVRSGMSYRHVFHNYASVITEIPECSAGQLSP